MSVGGFGTAVKLDRQQEEAFMAQKPPALDKDVIRSVQLYLDGGNDMVFKFQNGERRYALVVILQDHKSLGWKECQALADAMKVAQRGTLISNTSFDSVVAQLKQKYGSVKDPVVERGRLVSLVCPGRGDVRHTVSDVISHVRVSFDADGDLVVKAHTYSSQAYVLILQLPTAKQTFFREDCRAFIDVMTMLETGDRMEALTFVSLCGVLRVKYNFCTLHKKGDVLHGAVLASRVKNSAPVDSVMVKAMQAKKDELEAGAGAGRDGGPSGLPRCPYRGMSYLRALQESGQAQVYAGVVTSTGQKVAIKVFKGEADRASETYRTELRMLLKMSEHRNVIEVLEFFENPEPALVTRLIEGEGDMMAYIAKHGRFEEREARRICAELGEGIAHLHKAGIVHRDLKTPNVLLQQSASTGRLRPIVIDLGLGSAVRKGSTSTTMTMAQLVSSFAQTNVSAQTDGTKGTLLWMAPEMITNQEWSDKTDVFAFGIILWELLSGCRPYLQFAQLSVVELLVQIAGGARPDLSKISHVGRDLIRLIEQCWHQEPSQRPSMRRALDILRGNDPAAIFRSIDKDGSKSLDFGELVQFLQRYAPAVKPTEMADIFRAIDEDGSGGICFNEFQLFWKLVERNGLANALTLCQRARSRIS